MDAQDAPAGTEFVIKGRVLGPDGAPAAEAQVLVMYTAQDQRPRTLEVVTGADGTFTANAEVQDPKRPVKALARKAGLALDWVAVKPGEAIELRLGAEPVTFAGKVKGAEGEPVAGARIGVTSLHWPEGYKPAATPLHDDAERDKYARTHLDLYGTALLTTTTDGAGHFAVPDLPKAGSVSLKVTAEGRERLRSGNEGLPCSTQDFEIVLAPEAVIAGRVSHNGQPVPNAWVFYSRDRFESGTTQTQADGTFRLAGLSAGTYEIHASGVQDLTASRIGPFVLRAGQTVADANIEMIEGGLVKGTVRDGVTGAPVKGALVNAFNQRDSGGTQTDEHGQYAFRLPPGTYRVVCETFGAARRFTPAVRTVTVADKQIEEGIDFARGAPLRGRVVDAEGKPVAAAMVGSVTGIVTSGETFDSHFPAITDGEGRFELPIGTPPDNGRWPILALHRERSLAGVIWLPKGTMPEGDVELRLTPGGCLKGTVVDTDGKPLASIPVTWTLMNPDGLGWGVPAGETDAEGRFTIGALPPGVRSGVRPGGEFTHLVVSEGSRAGEVGAGVDLELEPIVLNLVGRTVRGTVLDAEQKPVANATVYVSGKEEGVQSGADGWWELTGLPQQGTLWFVAVHPTQRLVSAEKLDPDWGVEPGLMLQPPVAAAGRLLDQYGNPLAGMKVRGYAEFPIEWPGGSEFGGEMWHNQVQRRLGHPQYFMYSPTDDEGRWRAEGLIPGVTYRFSLELPDGTDAREDYHFVVEPQDVNDVGDLTVTGVRR